MIGVTVPDNIRCITFEGPKEHPLIAEELMMPILGVVRAKDFDDAVEQAVWLEHGNRHSAHIHSKNADNITTYAKAIDTAILVKNGPSYAALGFGGEGYCTFTIASRTGEGLTSAKDIYKEKTLCHDRFLVHSIMEVTTMEMNSANVEEVVKQVLESMLKTPVSAAPAAASKSQAIPETAHVAMLTALEHYDIKEFPMPEVGDGDILVKVEGCVCGTDAHEFKRDPFGLIPVALGHEGTGEIVKMGKNVKGTAQEKH